MVAIDEEGNRILMGLVRMAPVREKITMQFVEPLIGGRHAIRVTYPELYEKGIIPNKESEES